jgi:hypothetical protein
MLVALMAAACSPLFAPFGKTCLFAAHKEKNSSFQITISTDVLGNQNMIIKDRKISRPSEGPERRLQTMGSNTLEPPMLC